MMLACSLRLDVQQHCRICGDVLDKKRAARRAADAALFGASSLRDRIASGHCPAPWCLSDTARHSPRVVAKNWIRHLEKTAEVAERAGCVILRKTRGGVRVGLYRSADAGMECEPDEAWATVCEDHGSIATHRTRTLAEAWLSHPEEWCEDCEKGR